MKTCVREEHEVHPLSVLYLCGLMTLSKKYFEFLIEFNNYIELKEPEQRSKKNLKIDI
jgi:hypothetical protein